MPQHFVDEEDLPPKRKYPKPKRFHVRREKRGLGNVAAHRVLPLQSRRQKVLSGSTERGV